MDASLLTLRKAESSIKLLKVQSWQTQQDTKLILRAALPMNQGA